MSSLLAHLLQGLVYSLGDVIARHLPKRPPEADLHPDRVVLRHGWGSRIASVLLFPFLSFFFWVGVIGAIRQPTPVGYQELAMFFILGVLPMTLACFLLGETWGVRIAITQEGLIRRCPWRRRVAIDWDDIVKITYSYACNWFAIRGRRGSKIRAHEGLRGLPWLAKAILMNVPTEASGPAYRHLEAYAELTKLR